MNAYCQYNQMKSRPVCPSGSRGFILVTVLFLIAVIAIIAVSMSTTSSVQNFTTVYSLQQARAFFAAKSGLDYGIDRAVTANVCTNATISLPGVNFNVVVNCASEPGINEAGNISTVFNLSATASTGSLGDPGFVTRTVRSSVSNP